MTRIAWDSPGERQFEAGVDRAVLYAPNAEAAAWNGLSAVAEAPENGDVHSFYYDGIKYLDLVDGEDYKSTLTAFTYPEEFERCQGTLEVVGGFFATQQRYQEFGLSYRTGLGNDLESTDFGYKIHILYKAVVEPLNRTYKTLSNKADASDFAWTLRATPVIVPGRKPSAHFIIDSRTTSSEFLAAIEDILYGTDDAAGRLPTPTEIVEMIMSGTQIVFTDNGDGTWTATGPEEYFSMLDANTFQITHTNAIFTDADHYTVSTSDPVL